MANINYQRLGITPEWLQGVIAQHAPTMSLPEFGAWTMQESSQNPAAIGPKTKYGQAVGVTQLLPSTAKGLGVDPYDAKQNIIGGLKYWNQGRQREGTNAGGFMYHHGGPNKNIWGPKTKGYAKTILSNAGQLPNLAINNTAKPGVELADIYHQAMAQQQQQQQMVAQQQMLQQQGNPYIQRDYAKDPITFEDIDEMFGAI